MLVTQSCPTLRPWTVALAPLSMGFSRQEYWSGLPCPPPGNLPDPGIERPSLMSPALAGGFFTSSATLIVSIKLTPQEDVTSSPALCPQPSLRNSAVVDKEAG